MTTSDNSNGRQTRGRRGEGSIRWSSKRGCYRGELSLGYAPSGRRIRKTVFGRTMDDVRDKFDRLRSEHDNGVELAPKYTVAEAIESFLDRGLPGRSDTTKQLYRSYADNHVIPALGRMRLRDLRPVHIEDWLSVKKEQLSTSMLRQCLNLLKRSIRRAQRFDIVARNVAELVDVPVGRVGRPSQPMTLEQVKSVIAASEGNWMHAYLVLSVMTGIRTEEARALRWANVHIDQSEMPRIEVWRSVRANSDTKTEKSRRTIALPEPVRDALHAHRRRQHAKYLAAGQAWSRDLLVFGTRYDTEMEARNVRRAFKGVLAKAGLSPSWTPRELRHTFVSLMSAHGAPLEVIADLVGHQGTNTTESVYRHQLRPVLTEGADLMQGIFKSD